MNWPRKLQASDGYLEDHFGTSVAISGDTIVVGSHGNDARQTDSGAAYIFERDSGGAGNWGEVQKLIASDASPGDWFGACVDVDGDTAIVGAWRVGANNGAVYVFDRNQGGGNNWGEVKKLVAGDAEPNDQFGRDLAIDGNTIVVGAFQYGLAGPGKAYVFQRNVGGPNNWGQVVKITDSDAELGDAFGHGVAISGDTAVIGDPSRLGTAYVFSRNRGGPDHWGLVEKLTASDARDGGKFGWSIDIHRDKIVVGAEIWRMPDSAPGYVFERENGGPDNWGESAKLLGSGANTGDGQQLAVGVDAGIIVVSAPHDDDKGADSGSVYVFRLD